MASLPPHLPRYSNLATHAPAVSLQTSPHQPHLPLLPGAATLPTPASPPHLAQPSHHPPPATSLFLSPTQHHCRTSVATAPPLAQYCAHPCVATTAPHIQPPSPPHQSQSVYEPQPARQAGTPSYSPLKE